VVVLGDPGGGKSTLCQYLCDELSKHLLLGSQTAIGAGLEYQLQKIPLRIVLRTFEKARKSEPQLDMFSFICREIRNSTTLPVEIIESTI
jgi:predicted NACHT family NTPase